MEEDLNQDIETSSDYDKDEKFLKDDKEAKFIDLVEQQHKNNITDIPAKKSEHEEKGNKTECNDFIGDHNKIINDPETKHEDNADMFEETITIHGVDLSTPPPHTKPKKSSSNSILHQDYICTKYDHQIIQSVRNLPLSEEQILVKIGDNDATIDRNLIDCLFHKSGRKAYLNDEVINAYISLIQAEDHLRNRIGGSVFIETSFISAILKRDGNIGVDVNDSKETKSMKMRVSVYTDHDMVFLPINIEDSHWYLAVINAKRKQIQILDSTGPKNRMELTSTLNGLQSHIEIVSRHQSIPNKKWPDLKVALWPHKEIFKDHMQKDDCSCGLFMLNYMEYWEGENLTDIFNQDDMTQFRTKLVAILLSTDLNKHKVCPLTRTDDKKIGSPPKPEYITSSNKRKQCLSGSNDDSKRKNIEDDGNKMIDNTTVEEDGNKMIDNTPLHVFLELLDDDGLEVNIQTTQDMVDIVCDMVMMFNDTAVLETKWVRSYSPYNISISLKEIQDFLHMDHPMSHNLFNMGVRILANKELQNLRRSKQVVIKHYMDLKFCAISEFGLDPNFRKKINAQEISRTLKSWPFLNYHISSCRYILLPYSTNTEYALFILDQEQKTLMMFDPTPILSWYQDIPYKRFVKKIINVSGNFTVAMNQLCHDWYEDIFLWKHVPIDTPMMNSCVSGDIILQIMTTFDGTENQKSICMDVRELRKQFLIELLTYKENKSQFLIPTNIQDYLTRITGKRFAKTDMC